MSPLPPSEPLIDRFRDELAALGPAPTPLGIAFSGGPDSLALLLLAAAAFPGRVRAATVDHGLREGSAAEAALAARVCDSLGVAHSTLTVSVAPGASVQAHAREARYGALAQWMATAGVPTLLTAHHLDDQAETLLMRLMRGGGVAGLAGIRARRPLAGSGGALLRPLLGWRRAELAQIAAASGLQAVLDPSNRDDAFDRVRLRRRLAETPWLDPLPLARSAAALADAEDALAAFAQRAFAQAVDEGESHLLLRPAGLPAEIRRRLLLLCLRRFAAEATPRGEQVGELLAALEAGGAATLAGVKFAVAANGAWRIAPAPPRRLAAARKQP
jgi:tRNA(Ile)-lysidine synthase